ncbi:DUF535 family protein [Mucilaginibacter sp. HD30]
MSDKVKGIVAILSYMIHGQVLLNIGNFWKLSRVLSPFLKAKLISNRPLTIFLDPYISRPFDSRQRNQVLICHYTFLSRTIPTVHLRQLFLYGLECVKLSIEDCEFSIVLQKNIISEYEGPLSLCLKVNNDLISTMSFSFLPGELMGCRSGVLLYIAHLQRSPTLKANNDRFLDLFNKIHPSAILLKAIEAVAVSLDIDTLLAVGAANQLSNSPGLDQKAFANTYDEFWQARGAARFHDDYLFTLPLKEIPILDIKQKHRNKTVRRRDLLSEVYEICYANFSKVVQAS